MEAQLVDGQWLVEPELALEGKVDDLVFKMLELPQAECPLYHHFGPNIYIREVHLPAGAMAIGHYQKTEHVNVMIKGRVIILNEDGTKKELVAPATFVGKPGRKVGYILEDTVWQNIYATSETDVEKLEEAYIDKSLVDDIQLPWQQRLLLESEQSRIDYDNFLDEIGFTEEEARVQVENESDQIDMPYGWSKATVRNSGINGKGFFLNASVVAEEVIAPARVNGKRTPAGRYTNHSPTPNARMVEDDHGDVFLIANENMIGCKGGSIGTEITVNYRESIKLSNILEGR